MKFRMLLIGWLILATVVSSCQKKEPEPESAYQTQEYKGMKILVGRFTPQDLWNEIPDWKAEYMIYQPDPAVVEQLRTIQQDVEIVCVMGIWCPDSKAGVPGFLKALSEANNPHLKITLYGVDRQRHDPFESAKKYHVQRVPTFIVFRAGKEIGRMVEVPQTTFEADLIELLHSGKN